MNRLLARGQWQFPGSRLSDRSAGSKRHAGNVKFDVMRYVLGLLISTAMLFGAGELSGRRAPGFSLPDLQGRQYDLADYRGKVVLIDIFQTGCPHCQRLAEVLGSVGAKYGDKVAILSITIPPDNQATVSRFAKEHNVTTPILFDCGQASASYLKATPQNPRVNVPHIFLIDGQGMIRNDFGYGFDTKTIFEGDGLNVEIGRLLSGAAKAKK